ncbi:bifunctional 5,10-methylenetetrahydrofolate dehydrogenase/5,10-methenyltetrahydrofolate cyclohydrolase [Thermomicrobium sp. 4228-Ro]|uniref:bifunctional 5,10-methylenetetrahydrofolate dehydrogenase/5,10-methenyltetrahydrofolate cyclohydrolase n=1 Tax=Thermomicrobium sp. 4228-Ro TaxID=2993937 RepID=UPI0022494B21|nr:bifunctional 5,10-methylenetetrahydrofolate dehydrogenase/5,10-methenyltetrahydrofolate cyclohydrolase [Thermomicrobium sp. 4228-Ro]MCX2726169.1 bifunctional 5,10-methylenetetrahydrofolate dehydrogenase/5,10-methenyltetrahydrofolate cyclohydrolase [Thermomicrobium sp. 4228-Ro]
MPARLLTGAPVVEDLHREIETRLATLSPDAPRPTLALLVPEDPSARAYAKAIRKQFTKLNLNIRAIWLEETASEAEFVRLVKQLGDDASITGILALQPLPRSIPRLLLANLIPPEKDVDGVSFAQQGRLALGQPDIAPSTPLGGLLLLRHYGIEIAGHHAVVIGRSPVVGRPLALLLLAADATVTICHSRTPNLAEMTRQADILLTAAGHPRLVTADMVKPGAVVVDFGVSVIDGQLVGDVDPAVRERASALTPVPGGTGPVTTAVLACNLLHLAGLWPDWPPR